MLAVYLDSKTMDLLKDYELNGWFEEVMMFRVKDLLCPTPSLAQGTGWGVETNSLIWQIKHVSQAVGEAGYKSTILNSLPAAKQLEMHWGGGTSRSPPKLRY